MNAGELLILVSAFAALFAAVMYLGESDRRRGLARAAFGIHAAALVGALAFLAGLFLAHRFEYTYVASYSSRVLTPALTLAALWAGQEGSFLLWAAIGALVGVALMFQPGRLTRTAMGLIAVTQLAIVLLLVVRSPFVRLAVAPLDGQGLNPLLEDPWMVAHPPALFVGYAAMMVPFALAGAALMLGEFRDWNRMVWPWALFAVVSLGLGIVLGGIWAYRTLGWGGFWGWDPVENASLVPWLIAVALLHGLLIQRTLGSLARTNLMLAMLGWATTVGGTFLTRSGVLSNFSVHAFTDTGLYTPLLVFLSLTCGYAAALLVWRWRSFAASASNWVGVSRESALWLGLMTVLGFAVLVAVGTTAPLITAVSGKPASVQPSYYHTIAIPIGLLLLVLMALAPALRWVRQQGASWLTLLPPGIVAGGLVLVAVVPLGVRDPVYLALVFLTGFAIGINAWMAARLFKRGWTFGAGYAGHVGVALMALGIAVSTSAGRTERLTLEAGKTVEALGMKVTFAGPQFDARGARYLDMQVEGRGFTFNARPRLMQSPQGEGTIRTPAIHGVRELYVSPVDLKNAEPASDAPVWLERGTTVESGDVAYTFKGYRMEGRDHVQVFADVTVRHGGEEAVLSPYVNATPKGMEPVALDVPGLGTMQVVKIDADHGRVALQLPRHASPPVAVVDFSRKPLVNLVWIGALVMLAGTSLAGLRRAKEQRPIPVGASAATAATV